MPREDVIELGSVIPLLVLLVLLLGLASARPLHRLLGRLLGGKLSILQLSFAINGLACLSPHLSGSQFLRCRAVQLGWHLEAKILLLGFCWDKSPILAIIFLVV